MCKNFYDACYFTYLRVTPYWLNITDDNFETKLLVLASIYLYSGTLTFDQLLLHLMTYLMTYLMMYLMT